MTLVADRPDLRPFRAAPSRPGIVPNGGLVCGLLCLGGRFGFGGVGAGVCNPVVDECEGAVEAVGGQVAERDFRPRAGQVRLTVEPRDAVDVRNPGNSAIITLLERRVLPALSAYLSAASGSRSSSSNDRDSKEPARARTATV